MTKKRQEHMKKTTFYTRKPECIMKDITPKQKMKNNVCTKLIGPKPHPNWEGEKYYHTSHIPMGRLSKNTHKNGTNKTITRVICTNDTGTGSFKKEVTTYNA
jgi:hypothetical protein